MNCEGWKEYSIGDVVINYDKLRKPLSSKARENFKGEYPYYGAQGIIDYVKEYIFDGQYLLIAEDGENLKSKKQNIAQLANGQFWVNNHAHILKNNELSDIRFLCYILNAIDIAGYITGSAQPKLSQYNLNSIKVTLPLLYEQKAIAATLSCLDDKIELNNQMNDTLEQMAQALFKSWFVDFEPFQDGEFEDSELGKIPKGWKVGTVEELTNNIFSGGTPRTAVAEYWGGEYSWFSSGETRNPIIIGTEKKITKSGIENSSTKLAKKGSVLIASAGQGFTRGQTSLAMVDTYVNQSVVVLDIMPEYSSYLFFNLRRRYEELRGISDSSSIRGSLTTKIIRQLPILIPTLEDVLEFKKIADTIIKNMGDIQFENSTLTSLRDTLLPKLMSGEIRVPVESAE